MKRQEQREKIKEKRREKKDVKLYKKKKSVERKREKNGGEKMKIADGEGLSFCYHHICPFDFVFFYIKI